MKLPYPPTKRRVPMFLNVKNETKKRLALLAKRAKLSQGRMIDQLVEQAPA